MMITNKDPFAITTLGCRWWNWQIVTINHDITVMKWPRSVYRVITVTAKMFGTWTLVTPDHSNLLHTPTACGVLCNSEMCFEHSFTKSPP